MADIFSLFKKIEKPSENAQGPITHIVVGLGNPGITYDKTRHNTGFIAISELASSIGVTFDRNRFKAMVGEGTIASSRVLFMKPETFMNASGEAVAEAAKFYKIQPDHILVMCDDINLPVGRMRVRKGGSDGGQRGLRSIIACLGSEDFVRMRIGVGEKPSPDYDLAAWVLSRFSEEELEVYHKLAPFIKNGVNKIVSGDLITAMQDCNGVRI